MYSLKLLNSYLKFILLYYLFYQFEYIFDYIDLNKTYISCIETEYKKQKVKKFMKQFHLKQIKKTN